MPDGIEELRTQLTEPLRTQFEHDLLRAQALVRTRYEATDIHKRLVLDLPALEEKARVEVESRYKEKIKVEKLRQDVLAGDFPEPFQDWGSGLTKWADEAVRQTQRLADLEWQIHENQAQLTVAPSTKAAIYQAVKPYFGPLVGWLAPGRPPKEEELLAARESLLSQMEEASSTLSSAHIYSILYNGLPALVSTGMVTSLEDLLDYRAEPEAMTLREGGYTENDPVISELFTKVARALTPEGIEYTGELDYDAIASAIVRPIKITPKPMHRINVEEIVAMLTASMVMRPEDLPGSPTAAEALESFKKAGLTEEEVAELEDIETYINTLTSSYSDIMKQNDLVKLGLAEARMPELGIMDELKMALVQPGLMALQMVGKLYTNWIAPWAGMNYRVWGHYLDVLPGIKKHEDTGFDRLYSEAKKTEDWWMAGSIAMEEAGMGWANRLIFEWVADPLTWFGTGIPTKLTRPLGMFGKAVGTAERGWIKMWDGLIFDQLKRLGRRIPKTPMQASRLSAKLDFFSTAEYLVRASGGTHYRKIPLEKAQDLLLVARRYALRHPDDWSTNIGRAGQTMLRRSQPGEGELTKWLTKFKVEKFQPMPSAKGLPDSQIIGGKFAAAAAFEGFDIVKVTSRLHPERARVFRVVNNRTGEILSFNSGVEVEQGINAIMAARVTPRPVTREFAIEIYNVIGDLSAFGSGRLFNIKAAPRILLRTVGVAESDKNVRIAQDILRTLYRDAINASDDVIRGAKNVPDLLSRVYMNTLKADWGTRSGLAAHNWEMAGAVVARLSKVSWPIMNAWRNTIDRWAVTPFARTYLAFSAYGPFNILEGYAKPAHAGINPFWKKGYDPSMHMQRTWAGISKPMELELAIPRIEMAGETPIIADIVSMSPALKRWRYVVSGGPIGRFFIDLPGKLGNAQRTNYWHKLTMRMLGEEAGPMMQNLTTKIDDFTKSFPKEWFDALGLSRKELNTELLERAIAGPTVLRNMIDDMVSERIALTRVPLREAMGDKISSGRVEAAAAKYTQIPAAMQETVVTRASNGSLWKNFGRAIDDTVDDMRLLKIDEVIHTPEFYSGKITSFIDELVASPPRNIDEFKEFLPHIRNVQRAFTESLDDVNRAVSEMERAMVNKLTPHEWNVWRAAYRDEATVGQINYAKSAGDDFERALSTARGSLEALDITDIQRGHVTSMIDAWSDEMRYITRGVAQINETRRALLVKRPPTKAPREEIAAYWGDYFETIGKSWDELRTGAVPFRTRTETMTFTVDDALGMAGPPPPIIDASARKLTKVDLAHLFHANPANASLAALRLDTMALRSRIEFIHDVKIVAERMAGSVGKNADAMGWTDDAVGEVYDYIVREMRMSPTAASVAEPALMEMEALRHELWSIYNSKALPEGMAERFQARLMSFADDMDNIPGYSVGGKVTDDFHAIKQRSADRASLEYYKDWADYTNENVTTAWMRAFFPFWCVPEYATIMTKEGWKHYSDLEIGEEVLTADPDTLVTRWEPVQKIAEFDYDDDLMVIPAKGKDIEFTPNHRWVVINGQSNKPHIKRGYELTDTYDMIPRALPHEFPSESVLEPRLAAILGWVVTDGYYNYPKERKTQLKVYQSSKKYLKEVVDLVGSTATFRTGTDAVVRVFQADADVILAVCPRKEDIIDVIPKLSEEAANTMWDAMMKAEGNTSIMYNGSEQKSFKQNPGAVMQAFQMLSILVGKAITIRDTRVNILNNGNPYQAKQARRMQTKHYKGKVWCPVTPSGTWIMNCNGSVVLTSNTYEVHRPFWVVRTSLRQPGVFKAWGSYMDYTEDGYIHLPGTSVSFNPLRGTIWSGGMIRLIRADYPEFYDRYKGFAEAMDYYSRFGFYPAAYLNLLKVIGGTSAGGRPMYGELIPAWIKTPLNAFVAAFPDSIPGKILRDVVLPDPYREYTIMLIANKITQNERTDFSGRDLWDKIKEGITLTEEEQRIWSKAERELSFYGAIMDQAGILKIQTDNQLKAWEQAGLLIEEITGYTPEQQLWIRRVGQRVGDYVQLSPMSQDLLQELDAIKYHSGVTLALMPSSWQEEDRVRSEFFREVEKLSDDIRGEGRLDVRGIPIIGQAGIDRLAQEGQIGMSQWDSARGELRQMFTSGFNALANTDRYKNVPITLEDVVDAEGNVIRDGLATSMEKRGRLPPVMEPGREILNFYYALQVVREYNIDTGKLEWDWDGYFLKVDTIITTLKEAGRDDLIDHITREYTDLEKLRWQVSKEWFLPYNRKTEVVIAQFALEDQRVIKEYFYASPARQLVLLEQVTADGKKIISLYQQMSRQAGVNLRMMNPELDAWLLFFDRIDKPQTETAWQIYLALKKQWGLPQ